MVTYETAIKRTLSSSFTWANFISMAVKVYPTTYEGGSYTHLRLGVLDANGVAAYITMSVDDLTFDQWNTVTKVKTDFTNEGLIGSSSIVEHFIDVLGASIAVILYIDDLDFTYESEATPAVKVDSDGKLYLASTADLDTLETTLTAIESDVEAIAADTVYLPTDPAKESGKLTDIAASVAALPTNVAQETGGNLVALKDDLALIKADIDVLKDALSSVATKQLRVDVIGEGNVSLETGGNLATVTADIALIKADIDKIRIALEIIDDWDSGDKCKVRSDTYDLDDIWTKLNTIDGILDTIKVDTEAVETAVEVMDDWDDSNRAKVAQENRSTHWQTTLSTSGTIKAEESGKIVVITDITMTGPTTGPQGNIRNKNVSGTIINYIMFPANHTMFISYREGIEGAAYDGNNAGDLYWEEAANVSYILFTGYMKDA